MSAIISQVRGGGTRGVWLGCFCVGALIVTILLAAPTRARERTPRVSYLGPRVSYLGPARFSGPVTLRANAAAGRDRVVAVTFFLDSRPLGSDTTAPYSLDLDAGLLRPGSHRLRVVAVDNLGRRGSTRPITVRTAGPIGRILEASPGRLNAALAALRRGRVTVRLRPGRYVVKDVSLASGSRLLGAGARTVITAPPGESYFALLVARGRDIRISDLVLDGQGPGGGEGSAVAIFDGSSDVRLQRLQITHVRKSGVLVWGAHSDISIQDSRIDGSGAGRAGVAALGSDASSSVSVIRTRVHGFRDYGVLFAQREYGRPAAALHAVALDNDVSDIADPDRAICATRPDTAGCGTNESGIWSGGVEATIVGNRIRNTGWTGIETVGSSTRTTIVANDIRATRTGIYLEHSTNHSLILRNAISKVRTGINVEWNYDGVGSSNNVFAFNRVSAARSGLFADVGADGNSILGNVFVGGARPAIILQGSSNNVVQGNRGCGTKSLPLVREQTALWQDGRPAQPSGNRMVGNQSVRVCRAS